MGAVHLVCCVQAECDKILFGTNIAIAVGEAERLSTSLSKRCVCLSVVCLCSVSVAF